MFEIHYSASPCHEYFFVELHPSYAWQEASSYINSNLPCLLRSSLLKERQHPLFQTDGQMGGVMLIVITLHASGVKPSS